MLTVRGRQRSAQRRPGSVVLPRVGFRTELSLTWRKKDTAVVHHETIRTSGQLQNSCLKGQESPPPATPYTQLHPHPTPHTLPVHPLACATNLPEKELLPPPPSSTSFLSLSLSQRRRREPGDDPPGTSDWSQNSSPPELRSLLTRNKRRTSWERSPEHGAALPSKRSSYWLELKEVAINDIIASFA